MEVNGVPYSRAFKNKLEQTLIGDNSSNIVSEYHIQKNVTTSCSSCCNWSTSAAKESSLLSMTGDEEEQTTVPEILEVETARSSSPEEHG